MKQNVVVVDAVILIFECSSSMTRRRIRAASAAIVLNLQKHPLPW